MLVLLTSAPLGAQAQTLDFEGFAVGQTLDQTNLAFSINDAINAAKYTVATPIGSGNNSSRAIQTNVTSGGTDYYVSVKLLGYAPSPTDKVRYSFQFSPMNGDGWGIGGMQIVQFDTSNALVSAATGPLMDVLNNNMRYRRIALNNPLFQWAAWIDDPNPANPTAIVPKQNHWYEYVAEVDPNGTSDLDLVGEYGTIKYYLRDLSEPGSQLEQLQFKYAASAGSYPAANNLWYSELPAYLNGSRNTVNWNGVSFSTRGGYPVQMDNLMVMVVPAAGEPLMNTDCSTLAKADPNYLTMPWVEQGSTNWAAVWAEQGADSPHVLWARNDVDAQSVPSALNWLSSQNYTLNYSLNDFESANQGQVILDVVNAIRTHSDPKINNAWIGNYEHFNWGPNGTDYSSGTQPYRDMSPYTQRYNQRSSNNRVGLNVAMPSCYLAEVNSRHAYSSYWGENVTPNERAAIFYSAIQKAFVAKKNLPSGHKFIPYVSSWVEYPDQAYHSPVVPYEDCVALIKHLRLHGADSYILWNDWSYPGKTGSEVRGDYATAWKSIDWFFNGDLGPVTVLNLGDDSGNMAAKKAGLFWTAAKASNRILVQVSNLGSITQRANFAGEGGLPDESLDVAPGKHVMMQYLDRSPLSRAMDQHFDSRPSFQAGSQSSLWQVGPGTTAGNFTPSGNVAKYTGSSPSASVAWFPMAHPANVWNSDRMVYSAKLYYGYYVGFGASVDGDPYCPWFVLHNGSIKFYDKYQGGTTYVASNYALTSDHWYEVEIVITAEVWNNAIIYIRDLSAGTPWFTMLRWTNEDWAYLPLQLDAMRNNGTFNSWLVAGYYQGSSQIDDLQATLYTYIDGQIDRPILLESIPEPTTLALSAIGVLCLCCRRTK